MGVCFLKKKESDGRWQVPVQVEIDDGIME